MEKENYMQDAQGRLVPKSVVKPIDVLRDDIVKSLINEAKSVSKTMYDFKAKVFTEIASFIDISLEQYNVKLGGKKGNVTLLSYDGKYKIDRHYAEKISFGEQLVAAKALIDECIKEWSTGANEYLITLVNKAFEVDKYGNVSSTEILALRRHNFPDPKWQEAMQAIADAITITSSKNYIRFYERVGESEVWKPIPLNIAAD